MHEYIIVIKIKDDKIKNFYRIEVKLMAYDEVDAKMIAKILTKSEAIESYTIYRRDNTYITNIKK